MFDRFILSCAALVCASSFVCGVANAEVREVEADGEYLMGDSDSRAHARDMALEDAKKSAVEQVSVYVESYVLVNDYQVDKQQIASYTKGKLQIKSKSFEFLNDGLLCKAHIVATVDINADDIKNIPNDEPTPATTKPEQNPLDEPPPWLVPSNTPQPKRELFNVTEYNGHYYAVIDEGMDWRDADEYCRARGGHLVTINTPSEQKFVQGLVFGQGKRNSYWLGGYQSLTKGDKWYWVDGTAFEYTNWAVEQPDNLKETALMMYRNPNPLSESSLGEWNDLAANGTYATESFFGLNNFGFVCEWDSRAQVQYD